MYDNCSIIWYFKQQSEIVLSTTESKYVALSWDLCDAIPFICLLRGCPQTKHISLKYHHFRIYVKHKAINIFPIDITEKIADIFTKPLDEAAFIYLKKKLNGW